VLVTDPDCQHSTRLGVDVAVDQPESTGGAARGVELDAGQAGQVAADVPDSEQLAGDPSVAKVVKRGASRAINTCGS